MSWRLEIFFDLICIYLTQFLRIHEKISGGNLPLHIFHPKLPILPTKTTDNNSFFWKANFKIVVTGT